MQSSAPSLVSRLRRVLETLLHVHLPDQLALGTPGRELLRRFGKARNEVHHDEPFHTTALNGEVAAAGPITFAPATITFLTIANAGNTNCR